ncbi:MAG: [FeFe] hydrogenase H-cluster radical SAM maturase HydE [Chitinivibrionales bacterium]
MNKSDLIKILSAREPSALEEIRRLAEQTLLDLCGKKVYYRGLIEFSNVCDNDCFYCGIRKNNGLVKRYMLSKEKIVETALWCAGQGYGSVVVQSGERKDEQFVAFVEDIVRTIKEKSRSEKMPKGLGITLSLGEQSEETYKRFFAAGAHRYLLRIETSNPKLYAAIHPAGQDFHTRVKALSNLKKAGFQVGTGVMIGLPGQTEEDLADDLLFFQEMDVDMIGMGPYIVHGDTPMAAWPNISDRTPKERFDLALRMIAATRLLLLDVNIAAATALQALDPTGREEGLRWGANIIMPQVTPLEVRRDYLLYDNKPCLDESAEQCRSCLAARIESIGREVEYDSWGDSRHFKRTV